MTLEEKQLLLKDLSQRVSSGVCIFFEKTCGVFTLCGVKVYNMFPENDILVLLNDKYPIQWCKPYLRPMSSMTEDEDKEFALLQTDFYVDGFLYPMAAINMVNWLSAHYFDYYGLIEKELALEATKGMYNTK